jgi:transcriptional regulator GlxA family with amidase domain
LLAINPKGVAAGAFALAAAGLLDGRPATTHWQLTDQLQRRYPQIDVRPNQLYVDDGDILTSAGVTAGVDVCLHLIRTDHGAAAANACARALVAPPQRAGGQAQYIERLVPESSGGELAPLRDWMLENLTQPLSIDTLAERAHMSRRTLVRRFREETGTSPIAWLTGARLDRARELLERPTNPWNTSAASPGPAPPPASEPPSTGIWAPRPRSTEPSSGTGPRAANL